MTLSDFVAEVKAKAAAAEAALATFFAAHPEVEADAATAATQAVSAVTTAAQAEVESQGASLPPEVGAALDTAITATQAEADSQIKAIQDATAAKVASLQAAKAKVQPS